MSRNLCTKIEPNKVYTVAELEELAGISRFNVYKSIRTIEKAKDFIVNKEKGESNKTNYTFIPL